MTDPTATSDPGVLDDVLERLAGYGPEFGGGLSNHGPMAAEALVAMGQGEAAPAFVDRYRRALDPSPTAGTALTADEWGAALGDYGRFADFVALFEGELDERAVADVLADWVPRLAPGSMAAAGHGLIRTAHARRALEAADTPVRRHELAQGLAYWAARYQELPGPPVLLGNQTVATQLRSLPRLPDDTPEAFLITERVQALETLAAPFESAVVGLEPPHDPQLALDALASGGATAYIRNAERGHAVALVHAVTLPMALELLLDDVRVADRLEVFAYTWQAAAALHVCFAVDRTPTATADLPTDLPYPEEVIGAAVASGDEHAIKLAEAGLRAYRRTGEPVLLEAATDAAQRLG